MPPKSRSKVRVLLVATVVGVSLLAPRAEAADVTIGSHLASDATSNLCFGSCTYVQTSGGTPVTVSPVDGRVVRWRLKAGSTGGTVTLRVLRPAGVGLTAVASSATETVTSDLNTFVSDLPIKAGDVLGLDNATGGVYFTDAPAISLPLVKYFQPALGPGATGAPSNQQTNLELLMNADVTPDVGGGTPGGGTPGGTPSPRPAISKLRLKPATFPAPRSGGSVARRRTPSGTGVSYKLSVRANVAFKVERRRTGRKNGGKCRLGAHSGGRPCTRYTRLRGGFNVGGVRGANKFRFTGRLRSRKLVQGRYRLVATPSTDTRVGAPARAKFKIS